MFSLLKVESVADLKGVAGELSFVLARLVVVDDDEPLEIEKLLLNIRSIFF